MDQGRPLVRPDCRRQKARLGLEGPRQQTSEAQLMSRSRIQIPVDVIERFCKEHHIRRLSLFGSALRDDFGPQSDVDLLVDFEPGYSVGLLRLAAMEMQLSELLGRKVDLRTPAELSRYFRDEVLRVAEVQYAAG
jgi:predicted nucleotidyltransferase